MSGLVEWAIFLALSAIAIITAGGMLVTMSMYRAGLALMSSFLALAGLFILLDADLLAAIQVMMNVGGMLVMVLFMVMLMIDPGGEMMWDMKRKMHLPGPGAFSMSMPRGEPPPAAQQPEVQDAEPTGDWTCPMHPEVHQGEPGTCPKCGMDLVPLAEPDVSSHDGLHGGRYTCPMHPDIQQDEPGSCPKCDMDLVPVAQQHGHQQESSSQDGQTMPSNDGMHSSMAMDNAETSHGAMTVEHSGGGGSDMGGMNPQQHREMMVGMAMSTAQAPWALGLGVASALTLIVLMVRTPWPLSATGPTQDATVAVGQLLLSRYMIGFEGAAFLILAGIAGAVIFATREGEPPAPLCLPVTPATERQVYTCPMHPQVRQDHPGECPICGMDLVLAEGEQASSANAAKDVVYTCPMHPEVRQPGPGTCPKCGMDLVPEHPTPAHASVSPSDGSVEP